MTAPTAHEGEAGSSHTWPADRVCSTGGHPVRRCKPRIPASVQRGLGTFLLVLVAAGGGVIGATSFGGDLTLAMKALAPGMMVMGVIFFMGTISGAHLNPAVTLAFAVRGNFPWRRVPGYIVAELVGATLAALFLNACTAGS